MLPCTIDDFGDELAFGHDRFHVPSAGRLQTGHEHRKRLPQ
jgi:hypothetical protein